VNYLKSEPGHRVLVEFPGEFRLLGAMWKPAVDVTPLDTAIRGVSAKAMFAVHRSWKDHEKDKHRTCNLHS